MNLDWINDREFTRSLVDTCPEFNRGNLAGKKSRDNFLGDKGCPFQATAANMIGLLSSAESVMDQATEDFFGCSFFILHPLLTVTFPSWMIKDLREDSFKLRGLDFTLFPSVHQPISIDYVTSQRCCYFFFGPEDSIKDRKLVRPDLLGQVYCTIL